MEEVKGLPLELGKSFQLHSGVRILVLVLLNAPTLMKQAESRCTFVPSHKIKQTYEEFGGGGRGHE